MFCYRLKNREDEHGPLCSNWSQADCCSCQVAGIAGGLFEAESEIGDHEMPLLFASILNWLNQMKNIVFAERLVNTSSKTTQRRKQLSQFTGTATTSLESLDFISKCVLNLALECDQTRSDKVTEIKAHIFCTFFSTLLCVHNTLQNRINKFWNSSTMQPNKHIFIVKYQNSSQLPLHAGPQKV